MLPFFLRRVLCSLWFLPSLPALCQLQPCSHCTRNCSSLSHCCCWAWYPKITVGHSLAAWSVPLTALLCARIISHLGLIAACLRLGCVFMSLHSRSKHLTRAHRSCSSRINENILQVWQHSKGSLWTQNTSEIVFRTAGFCLSCLLLYHSILWKYLLCLGVINRAGFCWSLCY